MLDQQVSHKQGPVKSYSYELYIYSCSMCVNLRELRHFKTWWPVRAVYGYSTATYVSLTTGDAFDVYGRSLDRKLSEKWVFPWFSRPKSAFFGHAG